MSIRLILLSIVVLAVSGVPGMALGRRSSAGQWIAAMLNVAGSAIGAIGLVLSGSTQDELRLIWSLPSSHFAVAIDHMTLIFLIPMLLISALGSIYGLEYWQQRRHPTNGRKLRLCWGLLTASMMLVVIARDAILFLIAWEVMALATYFLVATEDRKTEVRRSAWIYLIATHVGTLLLIAMFAILRVANGSFDLWPAAPAGTSGGLATAIFITGIIGFGVKAGLMPLHVWLPGAHGNAPSHVSAIMSGVLLKAGVYGIIRVSAFLPHPPVWFGVTLLVVGSISGILGIVFAVAQNDFKRLLAYSSIENIGIITIGIGLALLGRSMGHPSWVMLGLGGTLLHVLNHSLFKPLLFMGAGSILHATHTRRIDLLGGLAKPMPRTFGVFVVGAIAICGLPPFNGFVSEFLIYAGLLNSAAVGTGRTWVLAALCAPALALIGALALATFVKLIGAIFLGTPRTHQAEHAHDPAPMMLAPMALLGLCCAIIGFAPWILTSLIQRAVSVWDPNLQSSIGIGSLVPLYWISILTSALLLGTLGAAFVINALRRRSHVTSATTWDCGYVRPTARIQYTGSSFSQMLLALFQWVLLPRKTIVAVRGLFPRRAEYSSEVPDTVLDRGLIPAFDAAERVMAWARPIQRGTVQLYLVYVLMALLALLLYAVWR